MPLKKLADDAVARIDASIPVELSDADRVAISKIVEQTLIDAVNSVTQRYTATTNRHIGHDADRAHKIAEALKLTKTALISNLEGMR